MDVAEALSFLDESVGYQQNFEVHAQRLFVTEDAAWDVKYAGALWDGSSNVLVPPAMILIPDMDTLERVLSISRNAANIRYFILQQKTSWDHFKISHSGFSRIFSSTGIYAPFLDYVRAFGTKFDAYDEDFGGFNYRFRSRDSYELCYNIRYVERHGREGEYPWSFRQTALYQKRDALSSALVWILLQPPAKIKRALAKIFENGNFENARYQWNTPLATHLMILLATEANWRPFIVEFEIQIDKLNDKAIFSRVGRQSKFDYSVSFSDTQEIQVVRQRILKAQSAIELSIKVAKGLQSLFKKLKKDEDDSLKLWLLELDTCISKLYSHRHSFSRLLELTKGTMTLLLKILDYRHDEVIQHNATATRNLLAISQHEGDMMKIIAQKTQEDSRTMKIMTFVAIIYLPGTFVASIFSSSLVNPNFVSFSIVTICLTALTIFGTILWDKGYLQSFRRHGSLIRAFL